MRQYLKGLVVGSFVASLITIGATTFSLGNGQSVIVPQQIPFPTRITAGACTGCTVTNGGSPLIPTEYVITVGSSGFITASTTAGVTIATIPAKMRVAHVWADLTQTYACASTCTTATLSFQVGFANNAALLGAFDADAAIGQFGFTNAVLGSNAASNNAAAAPFGVIQSWSATTAVTAAIVSGTGNVGTGAATNLSQGSATVYIIFVPFV